MKLKPQSRKASPVFSKVSDMKRWFEMTDKNKKILNEVHEAIVTEYASESGMIHVLEEDLESFVSSFLIQKLQEEREKTIEDMKKYNYILYKDEALFFVNAFLDVYREKLKSQEEHENI